MGKRRPRGEGSLYWHEKRQCWVGQFNLPDGKTKTKYGKTQKEVKDWLLKMRGDHRDGFMVKDEKVTLSQFLSAYMSDVARHSLRPKTVESYEGIIRLHINPVLGDLKLSAIRPDQLQRLYADKLESGLSARTVQYIHLILHKTLGQALKWGMVNRNVASLVDPPRVSKKEPLIWSIEQVKRFLRTVEGSRFEPMYRLAFVALREGEILGLHIEDFSREDHTITIRHAIQYLIGQGLVLTEPKTANGKRTIKLPDFAYDALVKHVDSLDRNQGLMFTTGNGTPFSPRNFFRDFQQQAAKADLPRIPFHNLRHTAISFMINYLKIPPQVVQQIAGHASPLLTLSVYTHSNSDMQAEAVERMNGLFD
jgi:integrase